MALDKVFIEQLEVITTIGVYDWEQQIKQKLVLDIEMAHDNKPAGKSDDVQDALDYSQVSEAVLNHIENGRFLLVERVAEESCRAYHAALLCALGQNSLSETRCGSSSTRGGRCD